MPRIEPAASRGSGAACWLPVQTDLTPHGLRLRSERMAHEVPGMGGIYWHVTPAMRDVLTGALQERWDASPDPSEPLGSRKDG